MVQVVWLLNKAGNTGKGGGLGQVLCNTFHIEPKKSSVVEKPAEFQKLQQWCKDNNYVEYPTKLCARFGQHFKVYAEPYSWENEHKGKNNIIATFLVCDDATGLAPSTVCGKALVVRMNGEDGEPVDLTKEELVRTGFFLNDLMDTYSAGPTPDELEESLDCWKKCFPYYDVVKKGDTMGSHAMNGNKGRWMSGVTGKQMEEDQECTFDEVEGFRKSNA